MAQAPLTDAQLRATYDAVLQHGGVSAAAAALGLRRNTLESRWAAAKRWAVAEGLPVPALSGVTPKAAPVTIVPSPRLPVTADECWTTLDHWIGRARIPSVQPRRWQPGETQRIVIASDFHAPFHDARAVAALIAAESDSADTLVINGDLMDFYSMSRFLKYERVTIEQELAATEALLAQLAAAFPDVLIVQGNHDAPRFEKQLRGILSPEIMHVIEFLTGGNLSVIHALAKRHPNVRFAPITVGRFAMGWAAQIGDLICTHAEKYSKVPGAALRGIDEWLTDQEQAIGLDPWRVLVQAHTHQGGVIPWKADRLLVEGGCMCETHGYQLVARIAGRPQRRGYVTLTQHQGVTDLNSVRFVWLDPALKGVA